jgi:Fe-Mn family superoxide dismutase
VYVPHKWNLAGLSGISDRTMEMHFGLYEGYVKNVNLLSERIAELETKRNESDPDPCLSELRRRLGYELDGMRQHELYFDNLTSKPRSVMRNKHLLANLEGSFGNFETWSEDFTIVGQMRGVGWAILYHDKRTWNLSNHWITLHQDGHPAGGTPILVMDVWEHAFLLDYTPPQRRNYIEAFLTQVDWDIVESRIATAEPENIK